MKNTGKGETSTIEQSKVDEPVEINNRNDVNRLEKMKEGQELKVVPIDTPLYENFKGLGYFSPMLKEGSLTDEIKLQKGDIVTYKGKYEKVTDPLTKEVTVYVEVDTKDGLNGYLKLASVTAISSENTKSAKKSNVTQVTTVTSRAGKEEKKIGQDSEEYVIAIAAGRNN